MGDFGRIDIEGLFSYSHDLVQALKNKKSVNNLMQSLEDVKMLRSSCEADTTEFQNLLEEYQKKIDACKRGIKEAKDEAINEDLGCLEKELEEELQKERSLMAELSIFSGEVSDLERQRLSVEDRKNTLTKCASEELKAQQKLSLYASVTNIIPCIEDQNKISGHIVERDQKIVKKFEFEPTLTSFENCNSLWKLIDL